jgi:hypothetical protein
MGRFMKKKTRGQKSHATVPLKANWGHRYTDRQSGRIRTATTEILQIFFIHCILPVGGLQITGPIVLAQHKANERIGRPRTPICRTCLSLMKSPINFAVLTSQWKLSRR